MGFFEITSRVIIPAAFPMRSRSIPAAVMTLREPEKTRCVTAHKPENCDRTDAKFTKLENGTRLELSTGAENRTNDGGESKRFTDGTKTSPG